MQNRGCISRVGNGTFLDGSLACFILVGLMTKMGKGQAGVYAEKGGFYFGDNIQNALHPFLHVEIGATCQGEFLLHWQFSNWMSNPTCFVFHFSFTLLTFMIYRVPTNGTFGIARCGIIHPDVSDVEEVFFSPIMTNLISIIDELRIYNWALVHSTD